MLVDTSAVVAVLADEEDAVDIATRMAIAPSLTISVVAQVEASIAMGRHYGRDYLFGSEQVTDFIRRADIRIAEIPADLAADVMSAYRKYGKGTGHKAALNFGDCFSYALAKRLGLPLLFKGDDFSRTDVESGLT